MNDAFEALKTAVVILIGIVVGILAWFGKDTRAETKLAVARIDNLERSVVTRAELTATLAQMREDRAAQHLENRETSKENRETMLRIETKIDENEERASRTRHDTNESVHELALQIAVLSRRENE